MKKVEEGPEAGLALALAASGRVPEAEAALVEIELEPEDERVQETLDEIKKWRVVGRPASATLRDGRLLSSLRQGILGGDSPKDNCLPASSSLP